ncbi:MAG: hypothetical protein ACLTGM_05670 [Oscillospiraceae bacterium]
MTNEELYRQYLRGDAEAFEQLYLQMQGFIASVAKDAAQSFGCSDKEILDELCAEGALELCERLSTGEYDENRGKLTTYLHPFLRGKMYRYLEANLGAAAFPKDEMQRVKQAQRLHKEEKLPLDEVAQMLGVSAEKAAQLIGCKTKSLSVSALSGDDPTMIPCVAAARPAHPHAGAGGLPAGLHGGTGAAFPYAQCERPRNSRSYLRRIRLRKAVCGRAWPARNALAGWRDKSQKSCTGASAQPVSRQRSAPLAGCVSCAERHIKWACIGESGAGLYVRAETF